MNIFNVNSWINHAYSLRVFPSGESRHYLSSSSSQLLKFSELTTSNLSTDNSLLKEELDSTRAQLVGSKKTVASMKTQLQMMEAGQEGVVKIKAPASQPTVILLDKGAHSKL